MNRVLKARVVKIGNSRGVRIPKVWLAQLAWGEDVEMAVQSDQIVIRAGCRPRQNWDGQFERMAASGDDHLLDESSATRWDKDEWQW